MTNEELAERGRQAEIAYETFVGPALETIRAEYMEGLSKVAAAEPWHSDKIVKLAVATKVIDKVAGHINVEIKNGREAAKKLNKARDIADMPASKRRWLDL